MNDYDDEEADQDDSDDYPEPEGKCDAPGCGKPVVRALGGVAGLDFDFCETCAEPGVMR